MHIQYNHMYVIERLYAPFDCAPVRLNITQQHRPMVLDRRIFSDQWLKDNITVANLLCFLENWRKKVWVSELLLEVDICSTVLFPLYDKSLYDKLCYLYECYGWTYKRN